MPSRAAAAAVLTLASLAAVAAQAPSAVPEASAAFVRKLDGIFQRGAEEQASPGAAAAARRTVIAEDELNAWIMLEVAPQLLARGIADPTVTLLPDNRVSSLAILDLEALRGPAEPSVFDPLSLLRGRVPVAVAGQVAADSGEARFVLEEASVGGIPVPPVVAQQLLTRYSRSPDRPEGLRLDEPFPLPAGIDRIVVGAGRAVVVQ